MLTKFIEKYNIDLSKEEVKRIIEEPWRFINREMSTEDYNEVRLMYFGVFRPIKSKRKDGKGNDK